MKRILFLVCCLFIAGFFSAQLTQSENYISSTTYLDSVNIKKAQTVQYFDGLGRLKQVVNVKASPLGNDIVNIVEYDQFGRQVKDYLPLPQSSSQTGGIYSNPLSNIGSIPSYVGEKIYAEKILEYSPLDRIQQQFQVGNDWNLNPVTFDYQANSKINDKVKKYNFLTSWGTDKATDHGLPISTLYDDNQLYKNSVKDEDGNESIEFKNGHGQTILVRKVLSSTENADTYYIYNDYNQLAYVIPPLAAIIPVLTQSDLNNLCYQYRYDGKGRLVEKRLPGKGLEYMVYDNQDRLIMTQDTKLKTAGLWLFTKYDQFSRVAFTGITAADLNSSRSGEQTNANNSGSNNVFRSSTSIIDYSDLKLFYTVANSYPGSTNISKLLSVNYYDFYPTGNDSYSGDGVDLPVKPVSIQGKSTLGDDFSKKKSTKGLPVASYVNSIEGNTWTKSFTWYDQKGRSIGTHTINHFGGYTKTESILDFTGIPQKIFTTHNRTGLNYGTVNIEETLGYDNQNRLKKHEHNVNNKPVPEILAENTYNELGQLEIKEVGGTGTPLQTVDYKYNIRGWITDVNNPANPTTMGTDLFGYTIRYTSRMGLQTPDVLGHPSLQVMPKYNGNIAEIDWNAVDETGVPPQSQPYRYGYVYDNLNRLKAGFYQEPGNPGKGTNNEIIEEYDLNGNIIKLKRFAYRPKSGTPAKIDDLTYLYSGNQVTNIADTGNASGYEGGNGLIEYDANGNMIKMPDKGITNIVYNYLNLPQEIVQTNNTKYYYLANGVKIKKSYTLNNATGAHITNTEYLGGFQYITNINSVAQAFKQTDDNTLSAKTAGEEEVFVESEELIPIAYQGMILSFFPTAEGFYDYSKQQYIYQYKDHLGNVRLSYTKNATTGQLDIPDRNDYYPFGMNFVGYHSVFDALGTPYNYKYNGKELQETGMYDYGARMYMPDIGRWGVVDPLAEKFFDFTGYNYVLNNPVKFVDKDGMDVYLLDEKGKFILAKNQEGNDIVFGYNSKTGDLNDNNNDKKIDNDDGQTVKTKGLIGQLRYYRDGNKEDSYGPYHQAIKEYSVQVEEDMFNLFYYAANNAKNVEFSLTDFNLGSNRYMSLQTYNERSVSPGPSQIGVDKGVNRKYHNHPFISKYEESYTERNSMGARENGIYYGSGGDYGNAVKYDYTQNYVFFPKSTNLYNVTKMGVYFIKKINEGKDLKR